MGIAAVALFMVLVVMTIYLKIILDNQRNLKLAYASPAPASYDALCAGDGWVFFLFPAANQVTADTRRVSFARRICTSLGGLRGIATAVAAAAGLTL